MKRMTILALLATATVAQSVVAAVPAPVIPKGARIGAAGFATIRVAPPSPTGDVKPQRPTYRTVSEWYAQEHGLTIVEARKRLADQQALMPAFERLRVRLAQAEPDNYVDAKIVHRPDWGYVLYFKRDPEATLRKYHIHPRFQAARASSTRAEVEKLLAPWIKRFSDAKILSVYGVGAVNGPVELSIEVTAEEYRTFATANGWGEVPAPIRLNFARDFAIPRVDPRIAQVLRGFASESRATSLQMEAGFSGRIILDQGCLRLRTKDGSKGPLAVFHKETGIGLDAQGYLAAIDRRTGKATGRIGEMWSWAGPNPGTAFDGLEALKAACGEGPIANVGNPESEARFEGRYARPD